MAVPAPPSPSPPAPAPPALIGRDGGDGGRSAVAPMAAAVGEPAGPTAASDPAAPPSAELTPPPAQLPSAAAAAAAAPSAVPTSAAPAASAAPLPPPSLPPPPVRSYPVRWAAAGAATAASKSSAASATPVTASAAAAAGTAAAAARAPSLTAAQKVLLTAVAPLLAAWCCGAFGLAWLLTLAVVPSYMLAQRLYWAVPLVPHVWARLGPLAGPAARIGFEASHAINVITRLLTAPLRPHLPAFYILGFPKAGTTSLAEALKSTPGVSGTAGLPYHEALAKETHFFQGVYGKDRAHGARLYATCFPSVLTRWWHEVVLRSRSWLCFDATPLNAACPHVAARIAQATPGAKFVVMLRDPISGVFSAEVMLRDLGVPLEWSLTEDPGAGGGELAQIPPDVSALWSRLEALPPAAPLPDELPPALYTRLGGVLQCGMYDQLLLPYLRRFPTENFLFVHFPDFTSDPERVVREVLSFVGSDPGRYVHRDQPPAMKNSYGSRKVHPNARAALARLYGAANRRLGALLGRPDLGWAGMGKEEV